LHEVQDHYFKQARREGYRSRAAYKLIEIDERKKVLRRGTCALDVGAAPGSWSQVLGKRLGPRGEVVAIDLKRIEPEGLGENVRILEGDVNDVSFEELGGRVFDVIVSDMAPDTTGDPFGDHHRSVRLCHGLLDRARVWLKPGGNLVMKVFEGEAYRDLLDRVDGEFQKAKGFKPAASRNSSVEMFIVAHGYIGDVVQPPGEGESVPTRSPSKGWGN
jgi:23S rRNA (uridine2552-2'-O)-methyltransferase